MDAIKELRRRRGWSQKDLAEESGVGQDTISGIESGKHEPRPSTLRKLATALDVEVVDFFRELALPKVEAPSPEPPDGEQSGRRRATLPDFKDYLLNECGSLYLALPHELFKRAWEEADTKAKRWELYEQVRREHAALVKLADEVRDDLRPFQREKLEKIWLRQANTRFVEATERVTQKTDA